MVSARFGERLRSFWFEKGWRGRWEAEIARRAKGAIVNVDEYYCFHTNPLFEPANAMRYTAGRYQAVFDELARLRPRSVLEIGCAHGLATWLMKDFAETVVGVDVLGSRIALGQHLFPEVELVAVDYLEYLAGLNGHRFDVMVCSHGPTRLPERVFDYCDHYVWIGYRPSGLGQMLTGRHKLAGRQLSHSTTMLGPGLKGRSRRYWKYYFTRDYLMTARHALTHGYSLPL